MDKIDENLLFSDRTILNKLGNETKKKETFGLNENKQLISGKP